MKKIALLVCFIGIIGCSEGDQSTMATDSNDLTSKECEDLGGKIVEGMGCVQEIPEDEMRAMCENNGMVYSVEFNGCLESE